MVKCRRKYQWKYENHRTYSIYYCTIYLNIEIYYRYVDIRDREIVIYTIRYILRDVLDILILSYIQCDEEALL